MALVLNILFCLYSCSMFFPTTRIQVPKGYVGWCYIVPCPDSSHLINKELGLYKIDLHGVAYVPISQLDLRNDNVVEVYEGTRNVTDFAKYMGRYDNTLRNKKYKYISFFMPAKEERIINNDEYWRRKGNEYTTASDSIFDSLLRNNLISIRAEQ